MCTSLSMPAKPWASWVAAVLCATGILGAGTSAAGAAQAQANPQVKSTAPKTAPSQAKIAPSQTKPAPEAAANESPDAHFRQEVLDSEQWKEMIDDFNHWASIQTLYDAQQIKQFKARATSTIARLSASELRAFLVSMEEKIAVLRGKPGREAQTYLVEMTATASPAYLRRIRARLPDVISLDAEHLERQLSIVGSQKGEAARMQKAFETGRQQVIVFNESQRRARQLKIEESRELAAANARANAAAPNDARQANDYFPEAGGLELFGPKIYGDGMGFF